MTRSTIRNSGTPQRLVDTSQDLQYREPKPDDRPEEQGIFQSCHTESQVDNYLYSDTFRNLSSASPKQDMSCLGDAT